VVVELGVGAGIGVGAGAGAGVARLHARSDQSGKKKR
jgi:hypothetical protein